MKKTKIVCLALALAVGCAGPQAIGKTPVYKDPKQPVEKRVEDLLSRMTIEEKVLQLNQLILGWNDNPNNIADPVNDIPSGIGALIYFSYDPAQRNKMQAKAMNSRLGIPVIFGYDVTHGYRTIYPIPLGQACSWNPALVEEVSAVAAGEARMSGVDWSFSPMIDVARDGRWGRVAEGYGEDPYTNGVFAVATVKGYQGGDMSDGKHIAACLKHFVGYGASEGGRDYTYTEISDQTLWDTYMLPYRMGVEAGAATVMSCFNDISGTPGSANRYLLTEVLKERWGHDGFVVSDWGAIQQLRSQGVAADHKEAALKAFTAGLDVDMMNRCYNNHLADLVGEGSVSTEQIDDAVKRVLRVKFKLGLFERPYTPIKSEEERFYQPEDMKTAERMAEESIVLLKNENAILPLRFAKKIAVIGPMANTQLHLIGTWSAHGVGDNVISIYDALRAEFVGRAEVSFAAGCDFDGDNTDGFDKALRVAADADVVVLCLGEKKTWSGENASRSTISLPAIQERLAAELRKAGRPIVLLLSSGRPLALGAIEAGCAAIMTIWQPGTPGGHPAAGVISGRVNPSGKLAITFPWSTGQIPIYYNHRQSARPNEGKYQDIPSMPLYEFGHGLSYTTFEYGDIVTPVAQFGRDEKFTVEITVKNSGPVDGMETVHWFVCDPVSTISRPVKELRYFEKQLIPAGEERVFRFEVDPRRDLSFVDRTGAQVLETGDYYIMVKDKKVKLTLADSPQKNEKSHNL